MDKPSRHTPSPSPVLLLNSNEIPFAESTRHLGVTLTSTLSWSEHISNIILAGGHVRASAGALAVHTALILAGGHVRASAGALAVHTALIPCVCVRVCPVTNSSLITPRIGTKFVSVDR